MKKDAGQEQVAIELRIKVGDAARHVQQVHDVLEQPALIRMVVLDARRRRRELADKLVVDQKALDERTEMGIAHPEQHLAQPGQSLATFCVLCGRKSSGSICEGSTTSRWLRMI